MTWCQVDIDTDDTENIPGGRSFHAATRVGKNIFIQGGKRGTSILRDFWMLSGLKKQHISSLFILTFQFQWIHLFGQN